MKFTLTKIAAGMVMAAAATGAYAVPVAYSSAGFVMFNGSGVVQDANSGATGTTAIVTGAIDTAAGTFNVASSQQFQFKLWTATGGTLYNPGTYTVNVNGDGGVGAGAGNLTFTVGAGQLGGNINFAWGTNTGIDVFNVWDVASTSVLTGSSTVLTGSSTVTTVGPAVMTGSSTVTTFDATTQYDTTTTFYTTTNLDTITSLFDTTNNYNVTTGYTSSNPNDVAGAVLYNGVAVATDTWPGIKMVDGPFIGFSANFNMTTLSALSAVNSFSTSETTTWDSMFSTQTVIATPVPEASTYGMMLAGLGLVGFAVRRRKFMA